MKSKKENKLIDPQKGEGYCLMYPFEKAFKNYLVPKISPYTETYYLTYLTLLWSALIIISGLLANKNSLWLLAFSVLIILQYFTDMLDGAVGRYKDTGLVKWGYYADHFLDYIFACSIIFGYHLYLQGFLEVNEFIEKGGDAKKLFIGKIAINDLPLVDKMIQAGILNEAKIIPSFIK